MTFSEQIFEKKLTDIDPDFLEKWFEEKQRETQHLEFKSGQVKMDKILKEISAFANSSGGIVIVGAPFEIKSTDGNYCKGSLNGSPIPGSLHFAQRVEEGIVPPPQGIQLKELKISDGNIFILEIPASENPPHQVNGNGKYYVRDEDVSRPATHEEIEALFFKRRKADLYLAIGFEKTGDDINFRLELSNQSTVSAEHVTIEVSVEAVRYASRGGNAENVEQSTFFYKNTFEGELLNRGSFLKDDFIVGAAHTVIYIKVNYYSRDVALQTKAAFLDVGQRNAISALAVYDSRQQDDFSVEDFFEEHRYLLH